MSVVSGVKAKGEEPGGKAEAEETGGKEHVSFVDGSLACRRFVLDGEPCGEFDRVATMAVRRYSFRAINADRGEKESFGWVNPRAVLEEELSWGDLRVEGASLVFLAARLDRKSLCPVLFRERLRKAMDKAKRDKGVERITRQHRRALEEQLTIEMLKETSASSSFTEVVWDRNSGEVFIGSGSRSLCERIMDLFASTFDMRLAPIVPSLMKYDWLERSGVEDPALPSDEKLGLAEVMDRLGDVGCAFMTWLYRGVVQRCEAEDSARPWCCQSEPGLSVDFPAGIALAKDDDKTRVALSGEESAFSPEVESALACGRVIRKAALVFGAEDAVWEFTLEGDSFAVSGCKLPVPKIPGLEDALVMRVQALQGLWRVLEDVFEGFLGERAETMAVKEDR